MANDGTLSVDDTKLTDIVNNHFTDFQNFFQTLSTGYAYNFASDLSALTDSVNGPMSLNLTEIRTTQTMLTQQISDFEDRLAQREKQLILQYSRVDTMLRQYPLLMAQITGQLNTLSQK
jgi:flagellar capping protein FliD